MKRWHNEEKIARREWRKHRQMHVDGNKRRTGRDRIGIDPDIVDCPCDDQIGRFRKKDAYVCGQPHCFACHSDKYPKREPARAEIRAAINAREQVEEFYST